MQDVQFVSMVAREPGLTPADLAARLGVSVRTVRTYTRHANAAMEGFARIEVSRGGGGYRSP